jgi:hypothetical protein
MFPPLPPAAVGVGVGGGGVGWLVGVGVGGGLAATGVPLGCGVAAMSGEGAAAGLAPAGWAPGVLESWPDGGVDVAGPETAAPLCCRLVPVAFFDGLPADELAPWPPPPCCEPLCPDSLGRSAVGMGRPEGTKLPTQAPSWAPGSPSSIWQRCTASFTACPHSVGPDPLKAAAATTLTPKARATVARPTASLETTNIEGRAWR